MKSALLCLIVVFSVLTSQAVFAQEQKEGWEKLKPMPTPRSEVVAVAMGEKIYVVGGFDKFGKATDVVEVFDTKNNIWSSTAPMPLALHHVAAAAHGGKLYVVGGYKDGWIASNSLFIYDPITDKWKRVRDMLTPRGALTAQFIDDRLYAVGGADHIIYPINEVYDQSTETWEKRKAMPTPREHLGSSTVGDRIYVIGGGVVPGLSVSGVNEAYFNYNVIPEFPIMIFVLGISFVSAIIFNKKFRSLVSS